MDNHNRLFAESQKFSTTQGFLAYYAPYILNDVGVYIPPSSFVAGLAMRRYRDEIAGFRLPPAGAKYSLSGARGVQVEITTGMQDVSNPYGLNALRQLPGYSQVDPDTGETYGPVFVWGGRTRINPANAEQALYKFVNTRVIMNVIYGTLDGALDGQIFNIIDGQAVTFNQIRTLVSNILYSQFFVPGCLFGSTAAQAFDVVVDARNNPPANLENGLVNVQVFVVPVPTLERIEIDLLRVNIGGISDAKRQLNLQ
jgi:phage tail sheath protein FI